MSTDDEWEKWGARDPYFGVLTNAKYRAGTIDTAAREEFFALGRMHVEHVLQAIRIHVDAGFEPHRVLDFGCGVGRLVLPFARACAEVVGVDVSPSMLAEAGRNCESNGLTNVTLLPSDDQLSSVHGKFDLVHTCIVLQHIETERGMLLLRRLLDLIGPGGAGALHLTFGWDEFEQTYGLQPPPVAPAELPWWRRLRRRLRESLPQMTPPTAAPDTDPEMQMNMYNMSQVMYLLQRAGAGAIYTELTNHGGALGAFMFFKR